MKKSAFLLLILLSVSVFAGPKFNSDNGDVINTGNHIRGKEVVYEIPFKNSGDADLVISNVGTSCGCSSALLSNNTVKPGESGSIKFTFNGIGMGKVQKSIQVSTNDDIGIYNITMEMNMVDPVTLDPTSIIAAGKKDEVINKVAVMQNTFDREITINEITANTPAIKVSTDKNTIAQNDQANINVVITIYEDSPVNGAVFIRTSEGEFQIPVFVDVQTK